MLRYTSTISLLFAVFVQPSIAQAASNKNAGYINGQCVPGTYYCRSHIENLNDFPSGLSVAEKQDNAMVYECHQGAVGSRNYMKVHETCNMVPRGGLRWKKRPDPGVCEVYPEGKGYYCKGE